MAGGEGEGEGEGEGGGGDTIITNKDWTTSHSTCKLSKHCTTKGIHTHTHTHVSHYNCGGGGGGGSLLHKGKISGG